MINIHDRLAEWLDWGKCRRRDQRGCWASDCSPDAVNGKSMNDAHIYLFIRFALSCVYVCINLSERQKPHLACKWKQNKECRRRAFNSKFIILFSHSLMDCKNKYAAITLWIERRLGGGGGREVGGGASVTSLGPSPWPHVDPAEFAAFRNNCSFTQNKHARAA